MVTYYNIKAMWNTMECKRDSFNGSLGGASETHWECVPHCLNLIKCFENVYYILKIRVGASWYVNNIVNHWLF